MTSGNSWRINSTGTTSCSCWEILIASISRLQFQQTAIHLVWITRILPIILRFSTSRSHISILRRCFLEIFKVCWLLERTSISTSIVMMSGGISHWGVFVGATTSVEVHFLLDNRYVLGTNRCGVRISLLSKIPFFLQTLGLLPLLCMLFGERLLHLLESTLSFLAQI